MTPVFANSAWVPARESLVLRDGARRSLLLPVRYGLYLHPRVGPVLIDTGYTFEATRNAGRSRSLRLYNALLRPKLIAEGQPDAVLSRFGLRPADVACVIVTHFHADHVAGLSRFPGARVIACGGALAAIRRRGMLGNLRHGVFAELLPADLETRLDTVSDKPRIEVAAAGPGPAILGADLFGDGSVLAIDLPGHAEGQFGVLFARLDPPLLYAADVQWLCAALDEGRAPGFPASLIAGDTAFWQASTALVRRFRAAGCEVMLCHDPVVTRYDIAAGAVGG